MKAVQLESKRKNIFEEFIKLKNLEKIKGGLLKKRRQSQSNGAKVFPISGGKSRYVKEDLVSGGGTKEETPPEQKPL